jgi:VanZ family protein
MFRKLVTVAAWALLIFIAYATLSPASARPEFTSTEPALVVLIERFGAYGLLGLLFYLAYPRRIVLVCLIVFGAAIVLELLQILIPDRDARIIDAFEKLAGGATGVWAARVFPSFSDRTI